MLREDDFDFVVTPKRKWYDLQLKEVYRYRDLVFLFVKRSFTAQYKQTVLGPAWFILNPLISSFISTIVFGNIAQLDSDGVPYFLFYLAGYCLWNYFATCITNTSATFTSNAGIMGKVYFPRLTMPISSVLFSAINMIIVFAMTLVTIVIYALRGFPVAPNWTLLLIPLYMIQTAALGWGIGIFISSITTKYRDLTILVGFGVSLWMYLTPVVYSLSTVGGKLRLLLLLNPMTPIITNFRYALLGKGEFVSAFWGVSVLVTVLIDLIGILMFNRVERTFMDTV